MALVWFRLALCLFVCAVQVNCRLQDEEPAVETPAGRIIGSLMTSRRGRAIHAYRGVPYAEPPVGKLRFQPPAPIVEYSAPVDARQDGPACPQSPDPRTPQDEDCLRLNVYAPPPCNHSSALPVLVYMHAGGFYSVSGRSEVAGPHYLLDRDLVLVTINYRLGSLGFLSTGDEHAPGNNGFKDQVAALRWVQCNIAAFGGDPGCVTVSGYSAGSISVALHAVSPMSKGLFHRAISMSGSPFSQVPFKKDLLSLAVRQARLVDCPITSTKALVDCLKTVPWGKLGSSLDEFKDFSIDPILIWTPVIENDFGQERFLSENPLDTITSGGLHSVPFIVSQTRDEFFWEAFLVFENNIYQSLINSEWYKVAQTAFLLPAPSNNAAAALRQTYLANRSLANNTRDVRDLGTLYGDAVIGFGVHRMANLLARHNKQPTYYYLFDYIGNNSHYRDPTTGKPVGVAHHDELIYLFTLPIGFPDIPVSDSRDSLMVDKLTGTLYNFARSGNPNPLVDAFAPLVWPALTAEQKTYLRISDQYSLGEKLFEDRFKLWDQLYPIQDRTA